jgi:hypothetical protein
MNEFRTRSSLLSIVEGAASLISTRQKSPEIETLLAASSGTAELLGLDRNDVDSALGLLVRAFTEEAALSAFGWLAARWDIEKRLANLRRLREEEMRFPEIMEEPIAAPIIITGSPRSGTTFLQTLLAEDPENQVLRCWQAIDPYPHPRRSGSRDPRPPRVDQQLRFFNLLAPDLHKVHPLNGWSPQECTEVTAHIFQSLRFDSTYHVPSYRKWLDRHGHLPAYRFHKRFLQHLQRQNGRQRWILKSPDHVFALGALRSTYPDARIVFMHRDPIKVLPSNAQLIEILRAPFTKKIDRFQIGRQIMTDLAIGAANMIETSRLGRFPSSQVFHLHYLDLVSRPLDAIQRLYRHCGFSIKESAREQMSRKIAARPNGGYAKNMYGLDRHGIDPDEVEQRFHDYMGYFDIRREPTDSIAAENRKYKGCCGLDSAFRTSAAPSGPAPQLTVEPLGTVPIA